jgi:uncharacterized protein
MRRTESHRLPHPAGGTLQLDLSYPEQPAEPAVVYVHGLGSNRLGEKAQAVEAACARRGWTFATFDFRGHGASSGTLAELRGSGLLADLGAVRAYLADRGVRRLCLVGSSMGGWASAWFAARQPEAVAACALVAPALDFLRARWQRLSEAERAAWRQTGRHRVTNAWIDVDLGYGLVEEMDLFPVAALAAGLTRPLILFHGMQDDTVDYRQSVAFAERCAAVPVELRLFNHGDHRLLAWKEEMAEAACAFFARQPGW